MAFIELNPLLNALDRSAGRLLQSRSKDDSGYLELAGALTSHAIRQGHVCIDLAHLKDTEIAKHMDSETMDVLTDDLTKFDLVGSVTKNDKPLILSTANKLYFHRYWHYEQRLITKIKKRLEIDLPASGDSKLHDKLNLGTDQKHAVTLSSQSALTLISGGPGTGKTTTVISILAHVLEQEGADTLRIALSAPTGKAAQRIQNSLVLGKEALKSSASLKERIPTEAVTLHRLLGYQRNSSQFKHNKQNPLPFDMVIVDEASMLDLLMFSKLIDALNEDTRLVLLGDSHQLASVEAGSIFGDLVEASRSNPQLKARTVELNENYRFGNSSALYKVCEYVKEGKPSEALSAINQKNKDISIRNLPPPGNLLTELKRTIAPHFLKLTQLRDPQEALDLMNDSCLLTPIRKGSYGVEGLNTAMESIIQNMNPSVKGAKYFSGQPILISENSYTQHLFNGDQGVILNSDSDSDSDSDKRELHAYFPGKDGSGYKRFPISALPNFESAYALTVHKSQGSEYRKVTFIIPPLESPILSRELVYTAISRSRETVELWGHTDTFEQAVNNRTTRTSGILDFLTGP